MKKYILSALLLAATFSVSAQKTTEPYMVKPFAGAKPTNVHAETTGGNITIIGEAVSSPKVEVFVEGNNGKRDNPLSKEEIQNRLSNYELNVSISGSTITAVARSLKKGRDWDWRDQLSISFKIYVPKNISTDLSTSGGNIKLSDLNGTQEFHTSGGNLTINTVSGKMRGRTSGGNITVKDSKDDIDLTTSGGNVTADNCSGTINLGTSGGNLQLSALTGNIKANTSGGGVRAEKISGDLAAHTSGGNITLKDLTGGVDASTSGGRLDVAITDVSKPIRLSNSGGDIYVSLPKNKGMDLRITADNIRSENISNFKGTQDKERIEGAVNGGGTSVRVNAGSGTVRLVMQ